ncbi:protein FAR1-RELATED SEQUENCE 5-like [Macadamia integrifolia]|uniref:protein FAR1-RELATED SEQUENCE 5-like n=1 Tax=Macadamia integrifolia TaxID=60698 RepID=UPI001C4F131F|nr:protein FAR1-RELATED SEQUENCE 5-like [Macadamia integrifolia]
MASFTSQMIVHPAVPNRPPASSLFSNKLPVFVLPSLIGRRRLRWNCVHPAVPNRPPASSLFSNKLPVFVSPSLIGRRRLCWNCIKILGNTMGDQDIGLDFEIEPRVGIIFNSEIEAYKFYNSYGGRMGFSVRRDYAHWSRNDKSILTSRKFVCSKQGLRKKDKRDADTKIPRAVTRTNCNARMGIVRIDNGQYQCNIFTEEHNHPLHLPATLLMMRSQRKVSDAHAIEIDLDDDSGIKPKAIFEYMSRKAGGKENIGFIRQDQKNYLRTKRQRDLSYGEAGSLLMPFGVFTGFNHHRGICIFGAALLYDETSESFKWLFEAFLKVHGQKKPLTIFTDQDAAMGNAISEYEEVIEFENAWMKLRSDHLVTDPSWLDRIYGLKEKWAKCFTIGMRSTQLSESLNGDLKDYLKSSLDLVQFFKHFERVVNDKRYNELKAEFDARNKTPRNIFPMSPIMNQALEIYTPKIFEELQHEYIWITACSIKFRNESAAIHNYIVDVVDREGNFNVECNPVGPTIACSCRKFETFGILCCHALKIFDVLDIKFILANYVLRRWTRGGRSMIVKGDDGTQVEEDVNLDCTQRYRILCPKLVRIASEASNSSEGYALVDRNANDLCAKLQNLAVDGPSIIVSREYSNVNKVKGIKNKSPRKGGKRHKSWVEKQRNKKKTVRANTSQASQLIQPSVPSHLSYWNPPGGSQVMDNGKISYTQLLTGAEVSYIKASSPSFNSFEVEMLAAIVIAKFSASVPSMAGRI